MRGWSFVGAYQDLRRWRSDAIDTYIRTYAGGVRKPAAEASADSEQWHRFDGLAHDISVPNCCLVGLRQCTMDRRLACVSAAGVPLAHIKNLGRWRSDAIDMFCRTCARGADVLQRMASAGSGQWHRYDGLAHDIFRPK